MDTIFGLASGVFGCGIAVIRVSGPNAVGVFKAMSWKNHIEPRQVEIHTLTDPSDGKTLDTIICIHFPPDYSYTGEDVIEFQLHGGKAAVESVLQAISKIPGCRHALPGEFTRRSFENGGFDLLMAEGTLDLLMAETELQRLQALDVAAGNASRLYNGWRESVLSLLARQVAAGTAPLLPELQDDLRMLQKDIREHMNDSHRGERMYRGITVALVGADGAGKTSLLHALVKRDVATVTARVDRVGDITEVRMDLGGYPVIMTDSPAEKPDLKIALFDGTKPAQDPDTLKLIDNKTLSIFTKSDLGKPGGAVKAISVKTGDGMDAFVDKLTERVATLFRSRPGSVITRRRHRDALESAVAALDKALAVDGGVYAAQELETAQSAIGQITGAVVDEVAIDLVFREFPSGT